jgi:hypothetical protein
MIYIKPCQALLPVTQFLLSSRLYCRFRNYTRSATVTVGRGLYRRWGITPRPEELIFICICMIAQKYSAFKNFLFLFLELFCHKFEIALSNRIGAPLYGGAITCKMKERKKHGREETRGYRNAGKQGCGGGSRGFGAAAYRSTGFSF